jgi:hypothetical protein
MELYPFKKLSKNRRKNSNEIKVNAKSNIDIQTFKKKAK